MFKRIKKEPVVQPRIRSVPPSSRTQAFSYNAGRTPISELGLKSRGDSSKVESKSRSSIFKGKRIALLVGIIAALTLFFMTFSVSTKAKIIVIQPNGFIYQPHTIAQYQAAASSAIGSSFYNRLKLTISSNDIQTQLEKVFPEISHAAVAVSFLGSTPKVYIQLAKPVLVYSSSSGSYALNGRGEIIADASILSSTEISSLPSVISSSPAALRVGEQALSSTDVVFVQTVKAALTDKGVGINKMSLVPMAEELDVYPSGTTYYIKFNLHENNPLQQVGTYLAAIATLKRQGSVPTQYIDVRVDGRAFYK